VSWDRFELIDVTHPVMMAASSRKADGIHMTKARCCAQAQFFKNDPMFEQMVSCINMNDYRLYPLGTSTQQLRSGPATSHTLYRRGSAGERLRARRGRCGLRNHSTPVPGTLSHSSYESVSLSLG
jgi:hypothetical protein